jgi:hypothetical protein
MGYLIKELEVTIDRILQIGDEGKLSDYAIASAVETVNEVAKLTDGVFFRAQVYISRGQLYLEWNLLDVCKLVAVHVSNTSKERLSLTWISSKRRGREEGVSVEEISQWLKWACGS